MKKWIFSMMVIGISAVANAGPSLNDQVDFSTSPQRPIVVLANAIGNNGRLVKGPWFSMRVQLMNTSSQPVTVEKIVLDAVDLGGNHIQKDFLPSDFNYAIDCNGSRVDVKFHNFGTFLSGDKGVLRLGSDNPGPGCLPVLFSATFFADDLPSPTKLAVTARFLGWFGAPGEPTERLDKSFSFETQ